MEPKDIAIWVSVALGSAFFSTAILGFMPVVPILLISILLIVTVSKLTPKPSQAALSRYFS